MYCVILLHPTLLLQVYQEFYLAVVLHCTDCCTNQSVHCYSIEEGTGLALDLFDYIWHTPMAEEW